MKQIIIIDNFDSFTYNLYQSCAAICRTYDIKVKVYRNNEISINQILDLQPSAIVISPGPGRPKDAGISRELIKELYQSYPILGICLGHQAIGEFFGAKLIRAPQAIHGKTAAVIYEEDIMFIGMPNKIESVMRYHSLVLDDLNFPSQELRVTARTTEGLIMAISHYVYPLFGLQFHPESFLSPNGNLMLRNFIDYAVQLPQNKYNFIQHQSA